MSEAWLECTLSKGMFPDESGVMFRATNGEDICLFCFNGFIDADRSRLRVRIVDRQGQSVLVRLPVDSLNGFGVVPVSAAQVMETQAI